MDRIYPKHVVPNPLLVLRKAGYSPFVDPKTGDESFIIRLTSEFYPRMHLYVEEKPNGVRFSLHIDQKKGSYGEGNMHAGEYDGPVVEKEMERIDGWIRAAYQEHAVEQQTTNEEDPKRGFFARLFGG